MEPDNAAEALKGMKVSVDFGNGQMNELVKDAQNIALKAGKAITMTGTALPEDEAESGGGEEEDTGLTPASLKMVKTGMEELRENASYNKCNQLFSKSVRDNFAIQEMAYDNALILIRTVEAAQAEDEASYGSD